MINLTKLEDKIYHLEIKDRHLRGMLFWRYQERYESLNERFRNGPFSLVEYMRWYSPKDPFSYYVDWSGFNIPINIIKKVHDDGIPDPNHYDQLMLGYYYLIRIEENTDYCYLIGTEDKVGKTFKHEMCHAYYFTNEKFQLEINQAWDELEKETADLIIENLEKQGYGIRFWTSQFGEQCDTAIDEAQAYIRDNDVGYFYPGKKPKDLKEFIEDVKKIHKKFKLS